MNLATKSLEDVHAADNHELRAESRKGGRNGSHAEVERRRICMVNLPNRGLVDMAGCVNESTGGCGFDGYLHFDCRVIDMFMLTLGSGWQSSITFNTVQVSGT